MQKPTPNYSLDELRCRFEAFNQEYLQNQAQFETAISAKAVSMLKEKLERGYCLNIACCGPCNSGKSTLLNFILGPESTDIEQMNSEIFLTNYKAETSNPWLFSERKTMPSDWLGVSHIDSSGKRSDEVWFSKFNEYTDYLEKLYSRPEIDKKKTDDADSVKPYQQINVSYGINPGPIRLWSPLFEVGLNLLDLQGLNEPMADKTFKGLEKPFILICCFTYSTAFLETEQFNQLKEMVHNGNPMDMLFVVTDVDHSIKRMARERKKNYETLMEDLKADLSKGIKAHFPNFNLFLFDLNSNSEEIRSSVIKIRQLLIQLRDRSDFNQIFLDEANMMLDNLLQKFEAEKQIRALEKKRNQLFQSIQEQKRKIGDLFESKEQQLVKILIVALREQLFGKIAQLAKNNRKFFLEGSKTKGEFFEMLNNWLVDYGLKKAFFEIFLQKIQQFCSQILGKIVTECPTFFTKNDEFNIDFSTIIRESFDLAIVNSLQSLSSTFELLESSIFVSELESIDGYNVLYSILGLTMAVGKKLQSLFQSEVTNSNFDKYLDRWLEKLEDLLKNQSFESACNLTTSLFTPRLKEEFNLAFNKRYSQEIPMP